MTVREYIGARYVPLFMGNWDDTVTYEPLSIVSYEGNSYTSRQFVPIGISIDDEAYWAETGNYNAQIEQYRQEVQDFINTYTSDIPVKNGVDDLPENQDAFLYIDEFAGTVSNYKDLGSTTPANVVVCNEDLSLHTAFACGMLQGINVNGNSDMCEAVTLMGTYLANQDKFVYGNDYTGTQYEGTFDNLTPIDPKQHLDADGRMEIDCAVFTTLVGGGCEFATSRYNAGITENVMVHPMFNPLLPGTKNYWRWDNTGEIGNGRLLTYQQAKMFFDAGVLTFPASASGYGSHDFANVGDILFAGPQASTNHFMGIGHCLMIAGFVNANNINHKIVAESVSGHTVGIISRTFNETQFPNYIKAKISPNYTGGAHLINKYGHSNSRNVYASHRNLNGNPFNVSNLIVTGAKVLAIRNNDASNPVTIHLNFSTTNDGNLTSTIDRDITITATCAALIILPTTWSGALTAAAETDLEISYQICQSDVQITVPRRRASNE